MKLHFEIKTEPLLRAVVVGIALISFGLIAIFATDRYQGIIVGILLAIVTIASLHKLDHHEKSE
jgi:hypothetical protein